MYFTYVLFSVEYGRFYIGSTAEPDTRFNAHNSGKVISTKKYRPWETILLETHPDKSTACKRERYLKSGWGRKWLKQHLDEEGWQSG